jgi:Lar family restriction alleviation protein|uniref:Restriction alleviation protein n=1 Tax=Siphoviridae sp. ctCNm48 TaxID=2825377 RepID=A0A8S5TW26_9CAUD|nr:MAG TPA: restriction alleviation protein [Siphoviridae sp. ctCNm48]
MQELKYCPFCGGEARAFEEWGLTTTRFYVRCMKCFCNTGTYNSRKLVIEKWNRRASQEVAAILRPIPIANVQGLGFPIPCGGVKGGPVKPSHKEIAETLREYAEWADANIYEVPIMLPDDLRTAADMLEKGE